MWSFALAGAALADIESSRGDRYPNLGDALDDIEELPDNSPPVTLTLVSGEWDGGEVVTIDDLPFDLTLEDATGGTSRLPLLILDEATVTLRDAWLAEANFGLPALVVEGGVTTLERVTAAGGRDGVTILGGDVTVIGGSYTGFTRTAFAIVDGTLTLGEGVDVSGNSSFAASAITALTATVELGEGSYDANTSDLGLGGALHADTCDVIVRGGATFTANTAIEGGALYATGSTVTIEPGASFVQNVAGSMGGAVQILGGTASIAGAAFDDNVAAYGGSIGLDSVEGVAIDDCAFASSKLDPDGWLGGGALYADAVSGLTGRGNTFTSLEADVFGGGALLLVETDATFTDTVASALSSTYAGGFATVSGGSFHLLGGEFTGIATGTGGVVHATDARVTLEGVTATATSVYVTGGLAAVTGGALTVRDCAALDGEGLSGLGIYAEYADVEISDSSFLDNVSWGGGGAITVKENSRAAITRVSLCGNEDPYTPPALVAHGALSLVSSRIWNNFGAFGAVGSYPGETESSGLDAGVAFAHNTFADNGPLSVYAETKPLFDRNLFATGAGASVYLDDEVITGSPPNFLEAGDDADAYRAELSFVKANPLFQEARPFSCDSTLWVSWDDPVAVDWAPEGPGAEDLDGTAPDFGAFGGPQGWPADAWDVDGDGNRNDVDCAPDDRLRFYGNADPNADCACDSDGDGWLEAWCEPAADADCDDADADVHPQAPDGDGDAVDADCDGAGGPLPDPVGVVDEALTFGGGGCETGAGAGAGAWLLAVLATRRGRARERPSSKT